MRDHSLQANKHLHDCIQLCWSCRDICQKTLFHYCLKEGGRCVEEEHVKLMTDCIESCQVSADFMTRNSANFELTCNATAEICDACAESCEDIGGKEMEECAEECRSCAEECRKMARPTRRAA